MTEHWHSNRTQIYWTCKALICGRVITHRDEIGEVDGWRLGAIVHNLRSKYGWPIATVYKGTGNIAHYSLPKGTLWRRLDFPLSAKMLKDEMHPDILAVTSPSIPGHETQKGGGHA